MRNIKPRITKKNKKGDFQFPFAWIFAIVAGMFILFLAIYGVVKFVNLQKTSIGAQTSMGIGVLTNPMESGFESERRDILDAHGRTRIYTECDNTGTFGKQIVRTSENTYDKWGEDLINVGFQNKYFFAKNPVEGRYFYLFSKPFEFPFKIADLIYITSSEDKYCFVRPPDNIEDQIKNLIGTEEEEGSQNKNEHENFYVGSWSDCPAGSKKICFGTESGCDVSVKINVKQVRYKDYRQVVYFEGDALMYAAIFSSPEYYECQLDRLIKRMGQLFEIYSDKSKFIYQETGCSSNLDVELMQINEFIKGFENSEKDLSVIYTLADSIGKKNKYADCKLW